MPRFKQPLYRYPGGMFFIGKAVGGMWIFDPDPAKGIQLQKLRHFAQKNCGTLLDSLMDDYSCRGYDNPDLQGMPNLYHCFETAIEVIALVAQYPKCIHHPGFIQHEFHFLFQHHLDFLLTMLTEARRICTFPTRLEQAIRLLRQTHQINGKSISDLFDKELADAWEINAGTITKARQMLAKLDAEVYKYLRKNPGKCLPKWEVCIQKDRPPAG